MLRRRPAGTATPSGRVPSSGQGARSGRAQLTEPPGPVPSRWSWPAAPGRRATAGPGTALELPLQRGGESRPAGRPRPIAQASAPVARAVAAASPASAHAPARHTRSAAREQSRTPAHARTTPAIGPENGAGRDRDPGGQERAARVAAAAGEAAQAAQQAAPAARPAARPWHRRCPSRRGDPRARRGVRGGHRQPQPGQRRRTRARRRAAAPRRSGPPRSRRPPRGPPGARPRGVPSWPAAVISDQVGAGAEHDHARRVRNVSSLAVRRRVRRRRHPRGPDPVAPDLRRAPTARGTYRRVRARLETVPRDGGVRRPSQVRAGPCCRPAGQAPYTPGVTATAPSTAEPDQLEPQLAPASRRAPLLRLWPAAVAALSGVLLYVSFPPRTLWWLALPAFALLRLGACAAAPGRPDSASAICSASGFLLPLLVWTGVEVGPGPWLALVAARGGLRRPGRRGHHRRVAAARVAGVGGGRVDRGRGGPRARPVRRLPLGQDRLRPGGRRLPAARRRWAALRCSASRSSCAASASYEAVRQVLERPRVPAPCPRGAAAVAAAERRRPRGRRPRRPARW